MTSQIYGELLDHESRCRHYHTVLDIVALKCWSCRRYYACYQCHDQFECHDFTPYPRTRKEDKVVICGVCHKEMSIASYEEASACPRCGSAFNPACHKHKEIYFS